MRRKILLSWLMLIMMLIIGQTSYATIEIIPSKTGDGKDAIVNISVSDSYTMCKGMKTNTGESLKGTGVDVHLATNKDWGAVSYLSNSIYGTNKTGGNTGIQVTISGVKYYSTTTNITGVMNWGANPNVIRYTYTSGIKNNLTSEDDNVNVIALYNDRETKYVEFISWESANTKGMAVHETSNKFGDGSSFYTNMATGIYMPVTVRKGLAGGVIGGTYNVNGVPQSGAGDSSTTFRPVIWN